MTLNRLFSSLAAAGLLLSTAGVAVAQPTGNAADNPFAIYRDRGQSDNAGTLITVAPDAVATSSAVHVVAGPAEAAYSGQSVSADNPFALYRDWNQSDNAGSLVSPAHVATAQDNAISQVAADPFN